MKINWRHIKSFFREEVLEKSDSRLNPGLQVWYAYGRTMLNSANVNYSFGKLDLVFRSTFQQLEIAKRDITSVLLLGLGAGNVPQLLQSSNPNAKITALEFDPEVIRLGKKYFQIDKMRNLEVVLADAFKFVQTSTVTFDLIIVDLFVDEEVPAAASNPEFLKKLAEILNPKGLLVFNRLSHTTRLAQQTATFGRKMEEILPGTTCLQADTNQVYVYAKN